MSKLTSRPSARAFSISSIARRPSSAPLRGSRCEICNRTPALRPVRNASATASTAPASRLRVCVA
jgi:hypothetical protein